MIGLTLAAPARCGGRTDGADDDGVGDGVDDEVGAVVEAWVSTRAAALRGLRVAGRDLVEPTLTSADAPGAAGAVLAPWPNRVEGARWWHDGMPLELDVTEPELGHANHGLLLERDYAVTAQTGSSVILSTVLKPSRGFPFRLGFTVEYALARSGITVTHGVQNLSAVRAPFALGAHPYLRVGLLPTDALTVTIAANRALDLDAGHIPRGEFDVAGTAWDLRAGVRVRDAIAHAGYTALQSEEGRVVHRLAGSPGPSTELWADPLFAWVQTYFVADFAGDDGPRPALAVEPMTAPPNALRTGEGLIWLQPGERWRGSWGLSATGPTPVGPTAAAVGPTARATVPTASPSGQPPSRPQPSWPQFGYE